MNPENRKVMEMAREAVGSTLEDAHSRAGLVCCNRPGYECCGSPKPEWSEADAKIMNVLGPIHKAIEERLRADEPKEGHEALLGAVARGWCHEINAHKEMDVELAVAIAQEVKNLYGLPSRSQADEPGHVKLPTSADEAELMAKVGMKWLEDNAPERLRQADEKEEPVAWVHGCHMQGNNVELWLPNCPSCGMPRSKAPALRSREEG